MLLTSAQHCCAQRSQLNEMLRHITGFFLKVHCGRSSQHSTWLEFPFSVTPCSAPWVISTLCIVLLMSRRGAFQNTPSVGSDPEHCHGHPFHPPSPPIAGDAGMPGSSCSSCSLHLHHTVQREKTVRETANSPIPSSFPEWLDTAGGSRAQPPCLVPQNCWALL